MKLRELVIFVLVSFMNLGEIKVNLFSIIFDSRNSFDSCNSPSFFSSQPFTFCHSKLELLIDLRVSNLVRMTCRARMTHQNFRHLGLVEHVGYAISVNT